MKKRGVPGLVRWHLGNWRPRNCSKPAPVRCLKLLRNLLRERRHEAWEMKRILVTRAAHQAGKLSDELRANGFEPVEVPVLEIQAPASYDALDSALRDLNTYDWLVFTSVNTIQVIVE